MTSILLVLKRSCGRIYVTKLPLSGKSSISHQLTTFGEITIGHLCLVVEFMLLLREEGRETVLN